MLSSIQRSLVSPALCLSARHQSLSSDPRAVQELLARALRPTTDPAYRASLSLLAQRTGKPERAWDLGLADGRHGVLRRPEPSDALAVGGFLQRTPAGPLDRPLTADLSVARFRDERGEPALDDSLWMLEAVKQLLWQAAAPGEDAFVLLTPGQVLGVARIEAQPEDCEPPLDPAWLADHGFGPSEVCISRMALAGEVRGQGLSHVLKRAQLTAAGDAGYRALASPWGNSITQAIARRAGGLVQTASMSGWVLIPVQTAGVKAQEVPGMLRS